MGSLNRDERQTLRSIQAHLRAATLNTQVVVEHLGTVDVYFHHANPAPQLNYATPHKGVAWVRREDLLDAFAGLERLGRVPRLTFLDALFPVAFQRQIRLMGLALEDEQVVMVYRPIYGPGLPGETPLGRLPDTFSPPITTSLATTRADLAVWLRVFRAAYYNSEAVVINPSDVNPLHAAVDEGRSAFVLASYENTPLGAARIALSRITAELEAVAVAPLWHGMGLEVALITTAVQLAMRRGCDIIFTIAPPEDYTRLYRRLGFLDLTHVLTFWHPERYAHLPPQAVRVNAAEAFGKGDRSPDEPDLAQPVPADE